jgi:hypothetical protein
MQWRLFKAGIAQLTFVREFDKDVVGPYQMRTLKVGADKPPFFAGFPALHGKYEF